MNSDECLDESEKRDIAKEGKERELPNVRSGQSNTRSNRVASANDLVHSRFYFIFHNEIGIEGQNNVDESQQQLAFFLNKLDGMKRFAQIRWKRGTECK